MKFINQSYGQAYAKSSNHNTFKIKTNNNKKSISNFKGDCYLTPTQ